MTAMQRRFTWLDMTIVCVLSAFLTALGFYVHARGLHQWARDVAFRMGLRDADSQAVQSARQAYANIVARRKLAMSPEQQNEIMRVYHKLGIWQNMWWTGIEIQKNPCDMWMMQQVIAEVRPDYIVETGTYRGGSATYFAQVLDGLGLKDSKVITIDIVDLCQEAARRPLWKHRVEFLLGSSTDPAIVAKVLDRVKGKKVLVVLDSDHSRDHVARELACYADAVSRGSYLVVEDTNIDGLPVFPDAGPGPMTAVREFLTSAPGKAFTADTSREAFVLTFNPGGWLKKE